MRRQISIKKRNNARKTKKYNYKRNKSKSNKKHLTRKSKKGRCVFRP